MARYKSPGMDFTISEISGEPLDLSAEVSKRVPATEWPWELWGDGEKHRVRPVSQFCLSIEAFINLFKVEALRRDFSPHWGFDPDKFGQNGLIYLEPIEIPQWLMDLDSAPLALGNGNGSDGNLK